MTRYTASGLDYTEFLSAVGTPSLIDGVTADVTATNFNGVAGFYVPVVVGSCVKFDASLSLADELSIRVSELAL